MTTPQIVSLLNNALKLDPNAMDQLFHHYAACNTSLGDHPTIQVKEAFGRDYVGFLGLLNGITALDK